MKMKGPNSEVLKCRWLSSYSTEIEGREGIVVIQTSQNNKISDYKYIVYVVFVYLFLIPNIQYKDRKKKLLVFASSCPLHGNSPPPSYKTCNSLGKSVTNSVTYS